MKVQALSSESTTIGAVCLFHALLQVLFRLLRRRSPSVAVFLQRARAQSRRLHGRPVRVILLHVSRHRPSHRVSQHYDWPQIWHQSLHCRRTARAIEIRITPVPGDDVPELAFKRLAVSLRFHRLARIIRAPRLPVSGLHRAKIRLQQ